jgi:hypothetical protein
MNATVRSARQAAIAAINGAKSHGPTTEAGKSRASLNSVRFGFSASHLLLPGEDPAVYEAFLDSWFSALAPITMPEATSVAQLADTSWKLERLSRVENGRIRARLEEELETTDEGKTFALTRRALEMVGALAMTVEAIPSLPKDFDRTSAFLSGVELVVKELGEVPGLPLAVVEPLAFAFKAAQENGETEQLDAASYKNLGNMAKVVKGDEGEHVRDAGVEGEAAPREVEARLQQPWWTGLWVRSAGPSRPSSPFSPIARAIEIG